MSNRNKNWNTLALDCVVELRVSLHKDKALQTIFQKDMFMKITTDTKAEIISNIIIIFSHLRHFPRKGSQHIIDSCTLQSHMSHLGEDKGHGRHASSAMIL